MADRRARTIRWAAPLIGIAALTLTACAGPHSANTAGSRYLAIAKPANAKLDHYFDALAGPDRADLSAAHADLQAIASIERTFDRALLGLRLPEPAGTTARDLAMVNEARAALTEQAVGSPTLSALHSFDSRMTEANATVEAPVRTLRGQLGLPPPDDD